jgi:hypothetical protein
MRTTESGFNEEIYLITAQVHITAANTLYQSGHSALTYYVAGLAVECLFRAYAALVEAAHDEKHDLRRLAQSGRFFEFIPLEQQASLAAALGDVYTRWQNNHRYRSEAALRRYLNAQNLYRLPEGRTIQGDVVKYNSSIILDGATTLVTAGVVRWKSSKQRWKKA